MRNESGVSITATTQTTQRPRDVPNAQRPVIAARTMCNGIKDVGMLLIRRTGYRNHEAYATGRQDGLRGSVLPKEQPDRSVGPRSPIEPMPGTILRVRLDTSRVEAGNFDLWDVWLSDVESA